MGIVNAIFEARLNLRLAESGAEKDGVCPSVINFSLDIVEDCVVKKDGVLRHDADLASQTSHVEIANVFAGNAHLAR